MPAEKIHDIKSGYHRVGIGWGSPDADVAVTIDVHSDGLAETEEQITNPADGAPRGWRTQTVIVDRDGINRMIRALRKARDAKFGRDE